MKISIALSRSYCLVIFLFVLISCSTNLGQVNFSYNKSYKVEESHIEAVKISDSEELYGTYGLFYVDNNHLLLRYIRDDFFGVWNVQDSHIERKFLKKGRGPGELISVSTPHPRLGDNGDILLDILSSSAIITVDYTSLMEGKTDYIVSSINREQVFSEGRAYSSYLMGDNILSQIEGDQDIVSFKLIRLKDRAVLKTFPIAFLFGDDLLKKFSNDDLLKPDRSKLALLMYEFNKIIIIDINNEKQIQIESDRGKGAVYHYGTCSNKYIYALYGTKEGDKEIQVFDWDGNFLKVLDTDYDLMDIAVNDDDSRLYALTEDDKLLSFSLE
jgi:hypothetical protein